MFWKTGWFSMGGNAFPRLDLRRIERQYIIPTLWYVVESLEVEGFTLQYARDNLMGSAGKQGTSGDLDFAVNTKESRFYGEPTLPLFDLRGIAARAREVLPEGHVQTRHLAGGQLQTAWHIAGDVSLGQVQVDFIAGDPQWLKFSHWSPGKDVSPWKGVLNSTMLGVLAKTNKDFELRDAEGEQCARIGWHFDLERGLHRKWKLRLREGHGMTEVAPDYFETHVNNAPHVAKLGYITDPTSVLSILFRTHTEHQDVLTFESIVERVKQCYPQEYPEIAERFVESFMRSAGKRDYTVEEVRDALR
jgi:hypothetical protein